MTAATSKGFGAVAYLNMLPFFADDPSILLCSTPAELNDLMRLGKVASGCSSVITGLANGLVPLVPLLGVAAERCVGSVYIEPLGLGKSRRQRALWSTWLACNAGGAGRLGWSSHETATGARATSSAQTLRLLTCGASAQSLWIVQTLASAQGLRVEVMSIPSTWHDADETQLLEMLSQVDHRTDHGGPYPNRGDQDVLTALLVIGDPALLRKCRFRDSSAVSLDHAAPGPWPWRLDVADLWSAFCGLPCIFALWFVGAQASADDTARAARTLSAYAQEWHSSTRDRRSRASCNFLASRGQGDLIRLMGEDALTRYLDNLRYDLSAPGYAESLRLMAWLAGEQANHVGPEAAHELNPDRPIVSTPEQTF